VGRSFDVLVAAAKTARSIHLREGDEVNRPALQALVREAVAVL